MRVHYESVALRCCLPVLISLSLAGSARAQFATVINTPPATIGDFFVVGSNTQLNVLDGAQVGTWLQAGQPQPTTSNVEVNIYGGTLGEYVVAYPGSVINVYGGSLGRELIASPGSAINIFGGQVADGLSADFGGAVNISGGAIGYYNFSTTTFGGDSSVVVSGGTFGGLFSILSLRDESIADISAGHFKGTVSIHSTATISGGAFGEQIRTFDGAQVTLAGDDFRLNGQPINGLEAEGDVVPFNLPPNSNFTATLADGSPLVLKSLPRNEFSFADGIADGTITLRRAPVDAPATTLIQLPADPAPVTLRRGQSLVVNQGGITDDYFTAGPGSHVVVNGGGLGRFFKGAGTTVEVHGGEVGERLRAYEKSHLEVTDGILVSLLIGDRSTANLSGGSAYALDVVGGSEAHLSGQAFVRRLAVSDRSVAHLNGGKVGLLAAEIAGVLNVRGGMIDGVSVGPSAEIHLFGAEFLLDGQPIDGLAAGHPITILERDKTLSGRLADGTPFSFYLNSRLQPVERGGFPGQTNFFAPTALLTLTEVAVPEPASCVLLLAAALGALLRPFQSRRGEMTSRSCASPGLK